MGFDRVGVGAADGRCVAGADGFNKRLRLGQIRIVVGEIEGFDLFAAGIATNIDDEPDRRALVDIGGDIRLIGNREDGKKWKIQVNRPPGIALRSPVSSTA